MRATDIEFVKLVGIEQSEDSVSLAFKKNVLNHIESIHASAQFTLAETESGLHLQKLFPELVGKVIPMLRESKIKYKKPALKKITAFAKCSDEDIEKFQTQFVKKGRVTLSVSVEVKDSDGVVTAVAEFIWFVQKL
jgi:acyl-coenzyme A thioesterase PaaI-like protein